MIDQSSRDLAVNDHSTTFLVEAAAGTGKTTLTIHRILALVESGVKIDRIAAVTFTVKAAGELKDRLRTELSKRRDNPLAAEALNHLDHMAVNTIHGFCSDLLRALPVEAKLEPGFQVTDELEQSAMRREFWNTWLLDALNGSVPDELDIFLEFGNLAPSESQHNSPRACLFDLFEVFLRLPNNASGIDFGGDSHAGLEAARAALCHVSDRARAAVSSCTDETDKLLPHILRVGQIASELPPELCSVNAIEWLRANEKVGNMSGGMKASWSGAIDVKAAKQIIEDARVAITELLGAILTISLESVTHWILPAVTAYREHQRAQGRIGFDDLLRATCDMLRESHTARRIFKSQFDFLHVDEFQDTDPVQTEILFYLAEVEGAHALDWKHVNLKPGKLFLVGDPKQSIYRFRGADLRIYNQARSLVEKSGKSLQIHTNFRSDEKILREVNEIFKTEMAGESSDAPDYVELSAADENPSSEFAVEILAAGALPVKLTAAQSAQREAEAIARHIKRTLAQGIELRNKNESRPLRFEDIAILVRERRQLENLTNELRAAEIPYVNHIDEAFIARTEIESALTLLSAIANPQDTMSVIGALRSPWFGFSDDELLRHRARGGSFVYTTLQDEDSEIGAALAKLRSWRAMARALAPSALLEIMLSESPTPIIYGLKSQGKSRYQNLGRLVDLMRRLEQSGETGVWRILDRVREMSKIPDAGDGESLSPADAVKILTIHKAKGLEFPFVYLFRSAPSEKSSKILSCHDDTKFTIGIASGGAESSAYQAMKGDEAVRQTHEENRCLYVAMTRACQRLIITRGWCKNYPALISRYSLGSDVNMPEEVRLSYADSSVQTRFSPDAPQRKIAADSPEALSKATAEFTKWKARRESALLLRASHTALSAASEGEAVQHRKSSARSAAMRVGTLVHSALETLEAGDDFSHALSLAGQREISTDAEMLAAKSILEHGINEELESAICLARRVYRELPFTQSVGDEIREGKIDLLLEGEDRRWIVVDYKTDDVEAGEVPARAAFYESQMNAYSQAVSAMIGRAPDEAWLYFLRPRRIFKLRR